MFASLKNLTLATVLLSGSLTTINTYNIDAHAGDKMSNGLISLEQMTFATIAYTYDLTNYEAFKISTS